MSTIVRVLSDLSLFDERILPHYFGWKVPAPINLATVYPSEGQWAQFQIFRAKANQTYTLVFVPDSDPAIATWRSKVVSGKYVLEIEFEDQRADPVVIPGFTSWEAAALRYRQWAIDQTWAQKVRTGAPFNTVLANTAGPLATYGPKLLELVARLDPKPAVWNTVGRFSPGMATSRDFDAFYANYQRHPLYRDFMGQVLDAGAVFMPYINGSLVDRQPGAEAETGYDAALTIKTQAGATLAYEGTAKRLDYMCPSVASWANKLWDGPFPGGGFSACLDPRGRLPNAVYLDVMAAPNPKRCWATNHGHAPGDPRAWTEGLRAVLRRFASVPTVAIEGFSELLIRDIDVALTWWKSAEDWQRLSGALPATSIGLPLLKVVYGDRVKQFGYTISAPGLTVNDAIAKLNRALQVGAAGWWDFDSALMANLTAPAWSALSARLVELDASPTLLPAKAFLPPRIRRARAPKK